MNMTPEQLAGIMRDLSPSVFTSKNMDNVAQYLVSVDKACGEAVSDKEVVRLRTDLVAGLMVSLPHCHIVQQSTPSEAVSLIHSALLKVEECVSNYRRSLERT